MQYLEITIPTAPEGLDTVVSALTAGGFSDLVIEDQNEFESFLDENRACWDYIDEELQQQLQGLSQIKLYLEDTDKAGFSRLETLLENLRQKDTQKKLGDLNRIVTTLAETNWEESWKDNYPPQEVGNRMVVLPYWLADMETDRLPVILDPGLTFGTGAHPSTQMVMQTMEELESPVVNCLDLGSGSGILSITALRLGAKAATGVDIDPKAEDIARQNAAFNGYDEKVFTALTGNVTADKALMDRLAAGTYDLVLVNIVADVIISLAPVLPAFMGKDTVLICSGILDSRLKDVQAALVKAGLTITGTKAKEDWRCIKLRRNL